MKHILIIYLVSISSICYGQEDKIAFKTSNWQNVNTLGFYKQVKPNSLVATKADVVAAKVEVNEGQTMLYFDKSNQKTSPEKAYYYRKIKLNKNNMAIGLVEDFYSKTNRPKFSGNYYLYKPDEENINNLYEGECTFYTDNGAKTTKKFSKGQIIEEINYTLSEKVQKRQVFNPNKTRKSFQEILFDANENEIGDIIGAYNTVTKVEQYTKRMIDAERNLLSITNYEDNCPKLRVTKYNEARIDYPVYLQDFTCKPNSKEWTFQNSYNFRITHNETTKTYQISSNQEGTGFLITPILSDFSKKKFEINAIFEKPEGVPIKEIGFVWQYLDESNYSYYVINLEKKTFEVNSRVNGEVSKWMKGVKPQINISDNQKTYTLKLVVDPTDPTNPKFNYSVNDQEITGFNKFPRVNENSQKNWNVGFTFRATKANEIINLKKLEVSFP